MIQDTAESALFSIAKAVSPMAVELQIRSQTFALLIARALQRAQMTTCIAPTHGLYVDHVDPVPEQARWSSDGAGAAILRLPLDVFLVPRDELLAAPDHVPAGARTPAGRFDLEIQVLIEQGSLVVTATDVLGGVPDDVRRAILAAVGTPLSVDVGALLASLGLEAGSSAGSVVLAGDLVVARFGSLAGPPAPVAHGFEWAFFLDGAAVEGLVRARIPSSSIPHLQSVTTNVHWEPIGATPFVQAFVEGPVEVPDPFTCRVTLSLSCTFSMPKPAPELRIDIRYNLTIDTGGLVFTPVELAVQAIEDEISGAVNPSAFGGISTGDDSFAITLPLPQIRVANEAWRYEGLMAGPAGLVAGGSVDIPVDLSHVLLTTQTHRFSGSNFASLFCSRDDPPTDIPLARFFSTVAVVEYEGGGALCNVEVIPGGAGYETHLTLPKEIVLSGGRRPGTGSIFVAFGPEDANQVTGPIQLIVSTPRGVRCCDLGQPEHFSIKEDGTIDGGMVMWFDDCNKLPPNFGDMTPEEYERWTGTIWYTYWGLVPGKDYDPDRPPILPDTLADIPPQWDDVAVIPSVTEIDPGRTELVVVVPTEFKVSPVETEIDTVDG
jgi:hypothetical protein